MANDSPALEESAVTAIIERGKFVWVVFGVYSDRSDAKILGIYTAQEAAEDRVAIAREAGAMYTVNYAKVPLDRAFGVSLRP